MEPTKKAIKQKKALYFNNAKNVRYTLMHTHTPHS